MLTQNIAIYVVRRPISSYDSDLTMFNVKVGKELYKIRDRCNDNFLRFCHFRRKNWRFSQKKQYYDHFLKISGTLIG
jgi:hypothetical protein